MPRLSVPRLSEVVAALENLWPAERAESWDAVGTVVGDPEQDVTRVLFAVDPVQEIVDEAVKLGADLLVTHHPSISAVRPRSRPPPSRAAWCTP